MALALRLLGRLQVRLCRAALATLATKLPRHRSRRAARAPADSSEGLKPSGSLPEWLFEERPVWLDALLSFLEDPDVLLVRLGGSRRARGLRPAKGRLPQLQEVAVPMEQLRSWGREELQEAADQGRQVRPVAVFAADAENAADAVQVLRSMGFKRLANLHTKAFLQQLQDLPRSDNP
ncbi:unnamed protein product [Cladocopium goreaui]|uniref:Uncharacterized protein n=1 Tax=Cladocopium goreaui TaxID=2562237 RepID=A0A9P1C9N9_9DINO|nr:unnamed protein product [Cladocopium goreaui]|mmetsp:Transcript_56105/g.122688  ORF Transcript_56105/g.122688 Transcript_56105/m.122688 type:complete len:178 (-) Transcript_56105:19-552(-)